MTSANSLNFVLLLGRIRGNLVCSLTSVNLNLIWSQISQSENSTLPVGSRNRPALKILIFILRIAFSPTLGHPVLSL